MSEELIQAVGECGAIVSGHFVLSSGRHSDAFFDADKVIEKADDRLAGWIASEMLAGIQGEIDTVLGVASGGNRLAEWCHALLNGLSGEPEVISEQGRPFVWLVETVKLPNGDFDWQVPMDGMCALYHKRVLVVEDVITTGNTVKKAIKFATNKRANVIGVSAMCSHNQSAMASLGMPEFSAAVEIPFNTYAPTLCPLCQRFGYESVRTDFGHGAEFLQDLRQRGVISA